MRDAIKRIESIDINKMSIDDITKDRLKILIKRSGYTQRQINTLMGYNTNGIAVMLSRKEPLSRWKKASFYYFFKCLAYEEERR